MKWKLITIVTFLFVTINIVQSKLVQNLDIKINKKEKLSTPLVIFTASSSSTIKPNLQVSQLSNDKNVDNSKTTFKIINFSTKNKVGTRIPNDKKTDIQNKGIYGITLSKLDSSVSLPIHIKGSFTTHNAKHGYLDPEEYYSFWYYQTALLIVAKLGIAWLVGMLKYRKQLVSHHYAITIVLFATLVEIILKLADFFYAKNHVCYIFSIVYFNARQSSKLF